MSYKLFENEKAAKFLYKHKNDKKLLLRLNKKYMEILKDPYNPNFKELKSNKCPKCQRAKAGNYRIIFYVSERNQSIEIIDIIPRKNNYMLF